MFKVDTDSNDAECMALQWVTGDSSTFECGSGSSWTQFPADGSEYTPSYTGDSSYHSFEVAFHATKNCVTKIKVWGKEPPTTGDYVAFTSFNTKNRPADTATPP